MSISAIEVSLRNPKLQAWYRSIVLLTVLPLSGCIASAPGHGGGGGQQRIVVTVSPTPIAVAFGATQQFTAAVTGNSNTSVTWSMTSASNCGGSVDSSSGLYTAPAPPSTLPVSPCPVTITATSNADNATTGQALADVHVVVTVSPATDTIGQGANLQYTASVAGAPNTAQGQGVNWAAAGAGAFDNPLNNPGLYVAQPLTGGVTSVPATITATSQYDQQQSGTANTTVVETDPLGTVSNVTTLPSSSCPADSNGGLNNGTCYSMTVSCDQVADLTTYTKVNTPPSGTTPKGTVLFLVGGGGNGLYDSNPLWTYGYLTVEMVNASFNTVQISFGQPFTSSQPNGWLQGPGGVRRLACRYATIADWVYNNPKMINANSSGANSAPMCATGNSGGSGAMAYAVYEYGLAGINTTGPPQELAMIEPTSGPVMTRLDQACVCNNSAMGKADSCPGSTPSPMCYSPSEADIIDPAYQVQGQNSPTLCSNGLSGADGSQAIRFASDSIDYQPTKAPAIPLSKTVTVNMRFGGMDTSTAVPQGETWWTAVGPTPPVPACTADAPHDIPSVQDGATNIANDILSLCK